ncbi:MAG: hypothetical protein ABEJ99_00425 [Candidatus Nanohaloarchaea archaeon]
MTMPGSSYASKRLKNAALWKRYREFDSNGYDALFTDVEFLPGHYVELGMLDLDSQEMEASWFYSASNDEEREYKQKVRSAFENVFRSRHGEDWDLYRRLLSDQQVSSNLLDDAPEVHGQVLVTQDADVDKALHEFSEGLFYPTLDSNQYDIIWVEGETIFD